MLVDIIKSYLKNEQLNISVTESDIKDAKDHGLSAMLYPVTLDSKVKKYYITQTMLQEKFIKIQEDLTSLFNQNEIKHFFVKGSVLYKLYPDITLRSRGDIDIYVSPSVLEKARQVLLNNNYKEESEDNMHHLSFRKGGIEVELHFSLFDDYKGNKIAKIFKEPFLYTELVEGSLYKLTDTMHLVYCLAHFARHLKFGGGFRYILDFYYILDKQQIDYQLLHKYIDELNYNVLYNNILNAIYYFTGKKYDNIELCDIDFFIDYMYKSGIHGFKSHDTETGFYGKSKFRYFISRVFMTNKEYRISLYPKAGRHWYLYIFLLIHHLFYLITHKFKRLFEFINRKPNDDEKKIYDKLGLYD